MLAYGMNGRDLPVAHGAPLRLRVERQIGYKSMKFLTELIVTDFFGLGSSQYRHYFNLFLPPIDIFYSFVKALLFAVVVTLIHCFYGFYATGGPAGVGQAAGRAIRVSIIAVVTLNFLLSLFFWGGQDTARIVG